jgi:hypothetical protein
MTRNPSRLLLLSLSLGLWLAIAAPVGAEEEAEGVPPRAHWLMALETHPSGTDQPAATPLKPEEGAGAQEQPEAHSPTGTPLIGEAPTQREPRTDAEHPKPAREPEAEAEHRPERPPSLWRSLASIALGLGLMLALVAGTRILLRWDRLD